MVGLFSDYCYGHDPGFTKPHDSREKVLHVYLQLILVPYGEVIIPYYHKLTDQQFGAAQYLAASRPIAILSATHVTLNESDTSESIT